MQDSISPKSALSQKNSPIKYKRQSTIEAQETQQREQHAEVLLIAIQTEEAHIIKLVQAVKDEIEAQREHNYTDGEPWPLLGWLGPFKVQQGLLIVGALYTFFAGWQLLEIRHQAKISERALISQQRARIQIRSIPPPGSEILQVDMQAFLVTIVNRGGTKAKILESNCTARLDASPTIPIEPGLKQAGSPYSDERVSFSKGILQVGESCCATATYRRHDSADQVPTLGDFRNDRAFFYVFGYIKYLDESGLPHQTAFCRRLDRTHGIFIPVDNHDYEYEE